MRTIAVIATAHNRVHNTMACLQSLYSQRCPGVRLAVYLTDDGSTDGTGAAIRRFFPLVKLLQGDGSMFWAGGMRLAFREAMQHGYDDYCWLNDDVVLDPDALQRLLDTQALLHERGIRDAIIAGSTRDPHSGDPTYGGVVRASPARPLAFELVVPSDAAQECETMNGQFTLLPASVVEQVGNLDPSYQHAMADYDYGLRARDHQCSVWVAPGTVGTCPRNRPQPVGARPLREDLLQLTSIKALPPCDWKTFCSRWAGRFWPLFWLSPYAKRGSAIVSRRLLLAVKHDSLC